MARIQLGPLAASVSGRMGNLLFRRTRWGPVVQSMHEMPDSVSDATLDAQNRFRVAARSWSLMYLGMRTTFTAVQRSRSTGSPGPWVGALLDYLAGRAWAYPLVTHPSYHLPPFVCSWFGDSIVCTMDSEPAPPVNRVWVHVFSYPDLGHIGRWYPYNFNTPTTFHFTPTAPWLDLHVVAIPFPWGDEGWYGQGWLAAVPPKP